MSFNVGGVKKDGAPADFIFDSMDLDLAPEVAVGGGDEARGIFLTMSCIAALSVFCFLTAFATTKERIPPAVENGSIKGDLAVLIRTGPWLATAAAAILGVTAIASRATRSSSSARP